VGKPQTVTPADALDIIGDYSRGVTLTKLAKAYPYTQKRIKAVLVQAGVWRDAAARARVRMSRLDAEPCAYDPFDEVDVSDIVPKPYRGVFTPMLTVSVEHGVTLNRMAEALEPFDVFEVRRCAPHAS
jgi:hypothetical protein